MTEIWTPGTPLLFMKVGTHAQEDLAEIIARKQQEITRTGLSMWGYGGGTCHPTTMVQPFARENEQAGHPIRLVMQPMNSKHFADPLRADDYSEDGINWTPVPEGIDVLGSRYALCLKSIEAVDEPLDLSHTRVAVGKSRGRFGSQYVAGRVDKACLVVADHGAIPPAEELPERRVEIKYVAELADPFAVFLRTHGG